MTTALTEQLAPYGIDYADAMDRFGGNDALFKRLALKYLDDDHYVSLVATLEADDFEEAYQHAHALKGVAGNLSLTDLHRAAGLVSDELHQGEPQLAKSNLPAVEKAHHAAIQGLETLQAQA